MIIFDTTEKCLLLVQARLIARGNTVVIWLHRRISLIYYYTCDVPNDNFRHDREVFAAGTC